MPSRHALKVFAAGACYHVYNRGLNKQEIFLDERDYAVFLHYLKHYLTPHAPPFGGEPPPAIKEADLSWQIDLLAFCLMPNHFHLLIKQKERFSMVKLMRGLGDAYVKYFNKRNGRLGPLFQGRYKAVVVESEAQLLYLTRYIHRNPLEAFPDLDQGGSLSNYSYSSYPTYLRVNQTSWVKPGDIFGSFSSARARKDYGLKDFLSYQSFVESVEEEGQYTPFVFGLTLE